MALSGEQSTVNENSSKLIHVTKPMTNFQKVSQKTQKLIKMSIRNTKLPPHEIFSYDERFPR